MQAVWILLGNLFGPGKDKTEFLIFDHYGNFDFSRRNIRSQKTRVAVSTPNHLRGTFELAQAALKRIMLLPSMRLSHCCVRISTICLRIASR